MEIKVSVLCTAYQHEPYIRQALESFVTQRTDFPFEVLVSDDASTDGTADIIREYAEKYPEIVRPFLQEKNLYSQGVNLYDALLFPAAGGECQDGREAGGPEQTVCLHVVFSFIYSSSQVRTRVPSSFTAMSTWSVSSGRSSATFSGHSIRQRQPLSR